MKKKTRRDLRMLGLEFIVIFLSITFSFFVEEWRSEKEERKVTVEFLNRLKDELKIRNVSTENFLNQNRQLNSSIKEIFDNFQHQRIPSDSLLRMIIGGENFFYFEPKLYTWESLLNSGKISSISSRIIDSVNLLLKDYRAIYLQNESVYDLFKTYWTGVVKDLPAKSFITEVRRFNFQSGVDETKRNINLGDFLNNTIAVDYYHSKYWLTKSIDNNHFDTLPSRERRLIEYLEKEIKE